MELSVGPAPWHWDAGMLRSLYRELAQGPAATVYVGETVCARRWNMSDGILLEICDELAHLGKSVYASSLILAREEEQRHLFEDFARGIGRVEINSFAFLKFAGSCPSVAGAFLNIYNSAAARLFSQYGVERIVLPYELGLEAITSIARGAGVAIEVVVHGHLPVGISSTCLTMRSLGRNGNNNGQCGAVCRDYPEGMVLEAGDEPLYRIEGPQTLSAATYCLVEYLPQLEKAGVHTVRILPQWSHTDRIVRIYRDVLDRRREARDAREELKELSPGALCNGWCLGKAGWIYESPN